MSVVDDGERTETMVWRKIELKGISGIIAAAVVAGVVFFGSGFSSDTDLTDDRNLRSELEHRLTSVEIGDIIDGVTEMITEGVGLGETRSAKKAARTEIDLVAVTGRKSILSFGSNPEYVLRVDYRVMDSEEGRKHAKTRYFRAKLNGMSERWSRPEIAGERDFSGVGLF